jgi:multidrug efflux pump subunit AcrA (membrane-fusion protein)
MVTTVHKDAVVHQPDGATVFVVTDGAAESRPIRTGLAVGERIEVVAGLEPGETVVVRGNERLRPGQKVSF